MADDVDMRVHTTRLMELVRDRLDEREREIITLRYGLEGYKPLTQREVAAHLKISRSYVSRIEKHALEILRDSFGMFRPDFED